MFCTPVLLLQFAHYSCSVVACTVALETSVLRPSALNSHLHASGACTAECCLGQIVSGSAACLRDD